jgi:hypothetical protein
MANALISADFKTLAELSKADLATEFVANSTQISKLKATLKKLEERNSLLEESLLPQIGLKYQPKGADFILMPKVTKGRKSTSYANVVEDAPKACNLKPDQITLLNDLLASHTKIGEDKTSIQIIK